MNEYLVSIVWVQIKYVAEVILERTLSFTSKDNR